MPKIVLFAGAGCSVESGISAFRYSGDNKPLWEEFDPDVVCNMDTWQKNKDEVDRFYDLVYKKVKESKPTSFHFGLKQWQDELKTKGVDLIIITSNVDDLFEKAGIKDALHVHGLINRMKCLICDDEWTRDENKQDEKCPKCDTLDVKTSVIFFGEKAPMYPRMRDIFSKLGMSDTAIVCGTSEVVLPVGRYVPYACHKIRADVEEKYDSSYSKQFIGPITETFQKIKEHVNDRVEGWLILES